MSRAEEAANKAYPSDRMIIGFYSTGCLMTKDFSDEKRLGFIEGYEQAEKFFISKLEEYMAKGEKCMDDGSNYAFWDGFHNCATNLLRELE